MPPGPVPPPDPSAPAGQLDFTFDRSGYRVPAIIVSSWVDEGIVINDEHRHTSMIATLRKVWDLGEPFTARDAAARPSITSCPGKARATPPTGRTCSHSRFLPTRWTRP